MDHSILLLLLIFIIIYYIYYYYIYYIIIIIIIILLLLLLLLLSNNYTHTLTTHPTTSRSVTLSPLEEFREGCEHCACASCAL